MIYVLLPAYNEAGTLEGVLRQVTNVLARSGKPHTFVICNDGSTDDTARLIEALRADYPISVVTHPFNQGVAQGFRSLLTKTYELTGGYSKDDAVVLMEADMTSNIASLGKLLKKCDEGCDIVCASRYRRGGKYVGFPISRLVYSVTVNWLMRLAFPVRGITDYTIFYRVYSARLLRKLLGVYTDMNQVIESEGFVCNIELLLRLRPFIEQSGEVPLVYRYDRKSGMSKMNVRKTIAEYLRFFFRMRRIPKIPTIHPERTQPIPQQT